VAHYSRESGCTSFDDVCQTPPDEIELAVGLVNVVARKLPVHPAVCSVAGP